MKKTAKTFLWTLAAFLTASVAPALAKLPEDRPTGQPYPGEIGLQPAASPMKQQMIDFHDNLLLPLTVAIAAFVMFLLVFVMVRFNSRANPVPSKTTHNTMLEVVWTLVPVLILVVVVVPSMKILYYVDRVPAKDAEMTLKVIGHQWYWEYTYPDDGGVNFFSNIVPDNKIDKAKGQVRLLSTDNPVVLPVDTNIRLLITASDVIHSWGIPALGVKLDAVPGRTNETWVRIDREGTFYGQCSQLCGKDHGFMPIEIHAVAKADFAKWVHGQGGKMPEEQVKGASAAPAPAATNKKEEKAGDK
jgi:cytochrome c oxidase subunit 2